MEADKLKSLTSILMESPDREKHLLLSHIHHLVSKVPPDEPSDLFTKLTECITKSVDLLLKELNYQTIDVLTLCAKTLSSFEFNADAGLVNPVVVKCLYGLNCGDAKLRQALIKILTRLISFTAAKESVYEVVKRFVQDEDAAVRGVSIEFLGVCVDSHEPIFDDARVFVEDALDDDDMHVRYQAIELLTRLVRSHVKKLEEKQTRSDETINKFFRLLSGVALDSQKKIRQAACRTLGEFKYLDPSLILQALDKKPVAAAVSLAALEDQPRRKKVKISHESGSQPDLFKAEGDYIITQSASILTNGVLLHGLEDEFELVRLNSVKAIKKLVLKNCIENNDEMTRNVKKIVLGYLVDMFNDEMDDVRVESILSLEAILTEDTRGFQLDEEQLVLLTMQLDDTNQVIRNTARNILSKMNLKYFMEPDKHLQLIIKEFMASLEKFPVDYNQHIFEQFKQLGMNNQIVLDLDRVLVEGNTPLLINKRYRCLLMYLRGLELNDKSLSNDLLMEKIRLVEYKHQSSSPEVYLRGIFSDLVRCFNAMYVVGYTQRTAEVLERLLQDCQRCGESLEAQFLVAYIKLIIQFCEVRGLFISSKQNDEMSRADQYKIKFLSAKLFYSYMYIKTRYDINVNELHDIGIFSRLMHIMQGYRDDIALHYMKYILQMEYEDFHALRDFLERFKLKLIDYASVCDQLNSLPLLSRMKYALKISLPQGTSKDAPLEVFPDAPFLVELEAKLGLETSDTKEAVHLENMKVAMVIRNLTRGLFIKQIQLEPKRLHEERRSDYYELTFDIKSIVNFSTTNANLFQSGDIIRVEFNVVRNLDYEIHGLDSAILQVLLKSHYSDSSSDYFCDFVSYSQPEYMYLKLVQ